MKPILLLLPLVACAEPVDRIAVEVRVTGFESDYPASACGLVLVTGEGAIVEPECVESQLGTGVVRFDAPTWPTPIRFEAAGERVGEPWYVVDAAIAPIAYLSVEIAP